MRPGLLDIFRWCVRMGRCEGLPAAIRLFAAYMISSVAGSGRVKLVAADLAGCQAAPTPLPGVEIKRARREDLGDILRLRGPIVVEGRQERGDVCYLAYAEGLPVSCAWYTAREDYMLELRKAVRPEPGAIYQFGVYTHPRWRGKGISGALTRALLADAAAAGYNRAEGLILESNRGALRMVVKAGYRPVRRIFSRWFLWRTLFTVEEGCGA